MKKDKPKGYIFGRPTDYSPEVIDKTVEYLNNYENEGDVVPTVEGLAIYLGTSRKTLYNWADKEENKDFLHTLEQLQSLQSKTLISGSLKGRLNPLISKLLLGKHGYKDQVGLSGEGEGDGIKLDVDVTGAINKIYGEKKDA